MAHSGEEVGGFQWDGIGAHGQSSNAEVDSNSKPNPDLRCANVLQEGHSGDTKIHDNMEAELVNLQGPVEEDGMKYGRSDHDES